MLRGVGRRVKGKDNRTTDVRILGQHLLSFGHRLVRRRGLAGVHWASCHALEWHQLDYDAILATLLTHLISSYLSVP
jgi:hypothetical protein